MDSMSTAEISEQHLMYVGFVDLQFQYWLSVSFAVIIATFLAGDQLSKRIRFLVCGLYFLATLLFAARYTYSAGTADFFLQELLTRIPDFPQGANYLIPIRTLVFISGFISTFWFILFNKFQNKNL
jgi:hypothetical protein